jgi:hypothetical protein
MIKYGLAGLICGKYLKQLGFFDFTLNDFN